MKFPIYESTQTISTSFVTPSVSKGAFDFVSEAAEKWRAAEDTVETNDAWNKYEQDVNDITFEASEEEWTKEVYPVYKDRLNEAKDNALASITNPSTRNKMSGSFNHYNNQNDIKLRFGFNEKMIVKQNGNLDTTEILEFNAHVNNDAEAKKRNELAIKGNEKQGFIGKDGKDGQTNRLARMEEWDFEKAKVLVNRDPARANDIVDSVSLTPEQKIEVYQEASDVQEQLTLLQSEFGTMGLEGIDSIKIASDRNKAKNGLLKQEELFDFRSVEVEDGNFIFQASLEGGNNFQDILEYTNNVELNRVALGDDNYQRMSKQANRALYEISANSAAGGPGFGENFTSDPKGFFNKTVSPTLGNAAFEQVLEILPQGSIEQRDLAAQTLVNVLNDLQKGNYDLTNLATQTPGSEEVINNSIVASVKTMYPGLTKGFKNEQLINPTIIEHIDTISRRRKMFGQMSVSQGTKKENKDIKELSDEELLGGI